MDESTVAYRGGCHCGNIRVLFEVGRPAREWPVRACQCAFCRAHGARTTSDPQARLSISVADASRLSRYRFALRTADYLVCAQCGVFVAAVLEADGQPFATLNVNVLDERDALAPATLGKADYVSIADSDTLEELTRVDRPALASLAVRFPSARLIDCQPLVPPPDAARSQLS